ncbi:MAG: zinc-dependent metalloprotease [Myxococcota bacterium]
MTRRALVAAVATLLVACGGGGDGDPAALDADAVGAEDVAVDAAHPGPDADVSDTGPDAGDPDAEVDAPAPLPGGTTDGDDGLIVDPADLEGLFVYGLNAQPGTALTQVGEAAAGAVAVPAVVEVTGEAFVVRIVDDETLEPIPGDEGVVESYPLTPRDDGTVRVDFDEPIRGVEVALDEGCVYTTTLYNLTGAPAYADGLLTWEATEIFGADGCESAAPTGSLGINIHFLRRARLTADFEPRAAEEDAPFGFFRTGGLVGGGDPGWMARQPRIGPDQPDGGIVYTLLPSFPDAYRATVEEVVEAWNDVLEDAVGNRPLALEEHDAYVVPWDPRRRVIHWDPSGSRGAVAPFVESPLTGEILDADVVLWLGDLDGLVERYDEFLGEHPALAPTPPPEPTARAVPEGDFRRPAVPRERRAGPPPPRVLRRRTLPRRPLRAVDVARAAEEAGGDAADQEALSRYIVADFLVHEIGHNLGLRHNFKGSIDAARFGDGESATTTMDYVIGMVRPGAYDRDAMAYGYGAGPERDDFLYCTDEDVDLDPGCARWDFGHPVRFHLDALDAMAEEYPPDTPAEELAAAAEEGRWGETFIGLRQLVNSEYEGWDPGEPVDALQEWMTRIVCEAPCEVHPWLRARWARYPLATRFRVHAWWEDGAPLVWEPLPSLTGTQAALLMEAYFDLGTDPEEPFVLKASIVDGLATSEVPGAPALLADLRAWYGGLEAPTEDDSELLTRIEEAVTAARK